MLSLVAPFAFLVCTSLCASEEILVQQHYNGEQFFDRTWNEFKVGFGSPSGNYWIGNERLHELTSTGTYRLRVDLTAQKNGVSYYAEYRTFVVGPESDGYRLKIRGYSGNAGNSLFSLNGMRFTTKDRDNDLKLFRNCAQIAKGGFWYRYCSYAPLNSIYTTALPLNLFGGFSWNFLPFFGSRRLTYSKMTLIGESGPAIDPCSSNPCLNGGTCQRDEDEYVCRCARGFAGDNCQKNEAECKATAPEDRINCGWGGVTDTECSQRSCCYDTTYTNRPVCYYQATECASIPAVSRANCGFDGISYPQCIGRGCCFDDDPDTNSNGPVCFRKESSRCIGVPSEDRIAQGGSTIHPNECLAQGWCYETSETPNCFSVTQ